MKDVEKYRGTGLTCREIAKLEGRKEGYEEGYEEGREEFIQELMDANNWTREQVMELLQPKNKPRTI